VRELHFRRVELLSAVVKRGMRLKGKVILIIIVPIVWCEVLDLFVSLMTQTMALLSTLLAMAKEFGLLDKPMKDEWRKTGDMLKSVMTTSAALSQNETDWDSLISMFLDARMDTPETTSLTGDMTTAGSGYSNDVTLDTTEADFLGPNPNVIVRPDEVNDLMRFIPFPSWPNNTPPTTSTARTMANRKGSEVQGTSITPELPQLSSLITSLNDLRATIEKKELAQVVAQEKFLPPKTLLELIEQIRNSEANLTSQSSTTAPPTLQNLTISPTVETTTATVTATPPPPPPLMLMSTELEEPAVAGTQYVDHLPPFRGIPLTLTCTRHAHHHYCHHFLTTTHGQRITTFSAPCTL